MSRLVIAWVLVAALAGGLPACEEPPPERPVSQEQLESTRHKLVFQALARHSIRESIRSKMSVLPRGDLLDDELLSRAYTDVPLRPEGGPWLWPASQMGLVLTLFDPQPGHRALLLGAQEGWAAMILESIGTRVHIWEPSPEWAAKVQGRLGASKSDEFDAAKLSWFDSLAQAIDSGPWDYVFVTGTVPTVPDRWKQSLRENRGKMVVPHGTPPAVSLVSISWQNGALVEEVISRGNYPYLMPDPTLNYASLYPAPNASQVDPDDTESAPAADRVGDPDDQDTGASKQSATVKEPASSPEPAVLPESSTTQSASEDALEQQAAPSAPADAPDETMKPKSQTSEDVTQDNALQEGNEQ